MKVLLLLLSLWFQSGSSAQPQTTGVRPTQQTATVADTTVLGQPADQDSLVMIFNGIGPYSREARALRVGNKIKKLRESTFTAELTIKYGEVVNEIMHGEELVMTVNDADAKALGLSLSGATSFYKEQIEEALTISSFNPNNSFFINVGIALLIIGLFIFGLRYYNRLFRLVYMKIHAKKGIWFKGFKVKNYELISEDKLIVYIVFLAKAARLALLLFIVYLLLPTIFSLFPWTQGIANTLFGYILNPLKSIGSKFLNFIPNLLTILVIIVVVRYLLKGLAFFRTEVAKGRLVLPGFYPEWSKPTYNLIKVIVIAISFVAIWPLLPMSESPIFKGVSTFFGLLVALGGAGAFSNVIAGLVITYMRSFKVGDRVKIADVMGDVTEKTLLNTKIKTLKNEIITIPNSQMLNSHTINYTTANEEEGLILHTTVTIGYDVPWRDVHKCLVEAALATEHVKKLPKPFVLQTSLDDFYVSYQINARTREIKKMSSIYSELHQNIQDKFNEAGIEILSPHYGAHRDGNQTTIPQSYLPEDYQAPWFRIQNDQPKK
ncbi:mechanosensitive ion channel-like protein [Roseivirga pacifica]|uniref:Mechanosensitive ion channel n=1 Tax=Roseivirga pacifica TaxID=1267423 RepID=A0A1I0MXR3_9BACT|nr:mechanosensitive ion channel family protein [Roseivirga pacifica]MCO6359313.1 mechanosensitive ion channel [Roseivirga pacifica]MCO6366683.1 mechanosensitive ion channel [Roseivirga pacifica]MCO6370785.1 mechanosensitive ion channel [Roseivirga pacifica]MCO6374339.1 mechanosensitive ion channel [Roseivirga pacifica]MCO6379598.1 mechanosensitive ion channel [Roseivirga pacifica]